MNDVIPEDFLASASDLVELLVRFGQTALRHSSQNRRDRQLMQSALSNVLTNAAPTGQLAGPPLLGSTAPERDPIGRWPQAAAAAARPAQAATPAGRPVKDRRAQCRCGMCRQCLDNARWERIYDERFADASYYGGVTVRHNSTLAEAR
jgi:hypothetical protein